MNEITSDLASLILRISNDPASITATEKDYLTIAHQNLYRLSLLNAHEAQTYDLSQWLLDFIEKHEPSLQEKEPTLDISIESNILVKTSLIPLAGLLENLFYLLRRLAVSHSRIAFTFENSSQPRLQIRATFNQKIDLRDLQLRCANELAKSTGLTLEVQPLANQEVILSVSGFGPTTSGIRECRRHLRIPVDFKVEIALLRVKKSFTSRVKMLSLGGAFVLTTGELEETLPEVNDILDLKIIDTSTGQEFPIRSRIASVCYHPQTAGVGVEFLDLQAASQVGIQNLLKWCS